MLKIKITLLLVLASNSFYSQDYSEKYALYINKEELKQHLYILASDSMQGRETGYAGQKMAADYLVNVFKSDGLSAPKGFNNYRFPFEVLETKAGGKLVFDNETYAFGKDFIYLFSDEPAEYINYSLSFIGNISTYDTLKFDAIESTVALLYVTKGVSFEQIRSNYELLSNNGAAAVCFILEEYDLFYNYLEHFVLGSKMVLNSDEVTKTCPLLLSNANTLDFGVDFSEKRAKRKWRKKNYLRKVVGEKKVYFSLSEEAKLLSTENVVAFIEGEDEQLKKEVLVLTAHYDHIGAHDGEIFNGADDDGSGTVALLEIAKAFQIAKNQGDGPKRSVLIMPVAGEEKGLLGSEYYSKHPIYPLNNTIANLNIDMIGRSDEFHTDPNYVYIIGSNMLSTDLHTANEKANQTHVNIQLDYRYNTKNDPNRYYYRSDHYNFAVNNIPSIFYFSGIHEDYHKATDTVDKIDFDKLEKITKLVFHTAWNLVNAESRPVLDVQD